MSRIDLSSLSPQALAEGFGRAALTPATAYRRFPAMDDRVQQQIFAHQAVRLAVQGGGCCQKGHDGGITALVCWGKLDWDSRHFGFPVGRLMLATQPDALEWSRAALADCKRQARQAGLRSLCVETDIDNYDLAMLLTQAGFTLRDTKRSFYARRLCEEEGFNRHSRRVEPFRPEYRADVLALVREAPFPSRFRRDPLFPAQAVAAMYESWMSNLLDAAEGESLVFVYRRQGLVKACGAIGLTDLSDFGVPRRFFSGGLYVGASDAVGAYPPIVKAVSDGAIRQYGEVETTVSLNNAAASRVIERMRSYGHVTMRHVWHLTLPASQASGA